ncbi:nitronate monooxygenase [Pseudarthrobacter sp. J1763]|uniref:nitronate monooxygenase n=1 Tax=Pseudarthrobacter sp. J1763 TaxID=3420445 RepID=UPI003D2C1BD7
MSPTISPNPSTGEVPTGLNLAGVEIIASPMAGGTTTTALVQAAHKAGALGFLAAGYKTTGSMLAEILTLKTSGIRFGVNVFVPESTSPDEAELAKYF